VTPIVAARAEVAAVERVFREAYGRAVATLIRLFGDITLAEDAVQKAFVVASDRWRKDGMPPNPGGMDRDDRAESRDRRPPPLSSGPGAP